MNRIIAVFISLLIPDGVFGTVTIASILGISLIVEKSLPTAIPLGVILMMTVLLLMVVPDCVHKNAPGRWGWEWEWICKYNPQIRFLGFMLFILGIYVWGITYIGIGLVLASQIGSYGFPYTFVELRQKSLK